MYQYQAVVALIFNKDGRVLSVSRKDNPDDIGLVGGKVDPPETILQALIRETFEETGYCLDLNSIKYIMDRWDGKFHVSVFKAALDETKGQAKRSEKETGVIKWVDLDDLAKEGNSFRDTNIKLIEHIKRVNNVIK